MTREDAKQIWLKDKVLSVSVTRHSDGVTEATVDIGQREMTPELHEAILIAVSRLLSDRLIGILHICIESVSKAT